MRRIDVRTHLRRLKKRIVDPRIHTGRVMHVDGVRTASLRRIDGDKRVKESRGPLPFGVERFEGRDHQAEIESQ